VLHAMMIFEKHDNENHWMSCVELLSNYYKKKKEMSIITILLLN
jgi:Trp operon repressor